MKRLATALALLALTAGVASAEVVVYNFNLEGSQEVPPVTTDAYGFATVTLDTDTNMISWDISYFDLSGPATLAHFHGPAPAGMNASPVINFANFGSLDSPIVGSTTITAEQSQQVLDALWYVNIHTQLNPGGEIRGQVVPEPTTLAMLAVGALALLRRR